MKLLFQEIVDIILPPYSSIRPPSITILINDDNKIKIIDKGNNMAPRIKRKIALESHRIRMRLIKQQRKRGEMFEKPEHRGFRKNDALAR